MRSTSPGRAVAAPVTTMEAVPQDQLRLVVKVARLYHSHGVRQAEIGHRLRMSQSKVSRLLRQAEDLGVVRTVVVAPAELNVRLEEELERSYGLDQAHVVDTVSNVEHEVTRDLGQAAASLLRGLPVEAPTIGFTSWSRTLRELVDNLQPLRVGTERVVELLGDLGPPALQHESARVTQRLAELTGAEPVFLRTPGVTSSPEVRDALLQQDGYARHALEVMDSIDLALVGVGSCHVVPPLEAGRNFFTEEQLRSVRGAGAVAEVCMRFLDVTGAPLPTEVDGLVTGITLEQLRRARRRWVIAGGRSKHAALTAALRGGWCDVLVTDSASARHLLGSARPEAAHPVHRPAQISKTEGRQ